MKHPRFDCEGHSNMKGEREGLMLESFELTVAD